MYQVLTYFSFKEKTKLFVPFCKLFFSYNGSCRKAKEEAFSVKLLLQPSSIVP